MFVLAILRQLTDQYFVNVPDLDDMVAPVLAELSKSDYGDVVSVVLDASDATMLATAKVLRDAGARVRWYWRWFIVALCLKRESCDAGYHVLVGCTKMSVIQTVASQKHHNQDGGNLPFEHLDSGWLCYRYSELQRCWHATKHDVSTAGHAKEGDHMSRKNVKYAWTTYHFA